MNNIALIIACHKSRDTILGTLHAAHHLARFPLQNIYIAHNASNNEPIDDTGPVVWASEFRDVHYCHIPVGNKTIALHYVAENYVLPANIPYVVMIDDDVFLSADVDFKGGYEQIMNDNKVKAVAYTIRGTEGASFWQKFQHVEYMQAGLLKMFQAKHGTILACHGAISLWDVKAVCDVFQLHNSEFHGDDLQMGIILQNMKQEFRIEANAVGPVATTTPQSLLYEPIKHEKSLFSQRVLSWDMAAHHFFLEFIWLTFFNWEKCGLILKPFLIIELWTMVQDWVRFLFLAAMFHLDPVLAVSLVIILFILQVVIILLFDKMVLSHRPELQSPTYICVLYPIYNAITIVFRFIGLLYNAVYYTPWNPPRILIQERKKLGLIPPPVAEPIGVPAEREFYWKNVWKLSTYSNVAPPQDDLVRTITNILVTSASITVDLTDANNDQF